MCLCDQVTIMALVPYVLLTNVNNCISLCSIFDLKFTNRFSYTLFYSMLDHEMFIRIDMLLNSTLCFSKRVDDD